MVCYKCRLDFNNCVDDLNKIIKLLTETPLQNTARGFWSSEEVPFLENISAPFLKFSWNSQALATTPRGLSPVVQTYQFKYCQIRPIDRFLFSVSHKYAGLHVYPVATLPSGRGMLCTWCIMGWVVLMTPQPQHSLYGLEACCTMSGDYSKHF